MPFLLNAHMIPSRLMAEVQRTVADNFKAASDDGQDVLGKTDHEIMTDVVTHITSQLHGITGFSPAQGQILELSLDSRMMRLP